MRGCSRTACSRRAVATLTYNYADSTAVLGPLATYAEPHTYDLCAAHAQSLTVPQGWEVVRLVTDYSSAAEAPDDLTAVVDAVRDTRAPEAATRPPGGRGAQSPSASDPHRDGPARGYPERLEPMPLRREAAGAESGGGDGPRVRRLRVLRDGESWDQDR